MLFERWPVMEQAEDGESGGASGGAANSTDDSGQSKDIKSAWPDDWRQKIAGENEKELSLLGRYASPADVWKKARALEQKLSSGELKSILRKDASPDETKAWREQNGIPETYDKYDLDLGNNLKVSDEDKILFDDYLKGAHATNQSPDQVKSTLNAYYKIQDQLTTKRANDDKDIAQKTEDALRAEWGNEYRRNINLVNNLLDNVGGSAEFKDKILRGRLADGTPIGSSPDALKMFLQLSLVNNPVGTVVPSGSGDMLKSVEDEIRQIEDFMKKNRTAYFKDEKKQDRYRELLNARDQLHKRK